MADQTLILRPSADAEAISATGWSKTGGTYYYENVDESVLNEADYINNATAVGSSWCVKNGGVYSGYAISGLVEDIDMLVSYQLEAVNPVAKRKWSWADLVGGCSFGFIDTSVDFLTYYPCVFTMGSGRTNENGIIKSVTMNAQIRLDTEKGYLHTIYQFWLSVVWEESKRKIIIF